MTLRAARIPEPQWDDHKNHIRSLYLEDGLKLKGSGGLIEVMTAHHAFSASEAQYERHLKKWGFLKNQKKDVWETLSRKVEKRKLDGKGSEVYRNNKLVKTAQRQFTRYKPIQGLYEKVLPSDQAPSPPTPPTPEGFVISTPRALTPETPEHFIISISNQEGSVFSFSPWAYDLPSYKLEWGLIFHTIVNVVKLSSREQALGRFLRAPKTLYSLKNAMLPSAGLEERSIRTSFNFMSEDVDWLNSLLRLVTFSMANNFINLNNTTYEILKFLKNTNQQLFQNLLSLKGPAIEAFGEKLFQYAIDVGDMRLVDILLQNISLDLNNIVFEVYGFPFTPVEFASMLGRVEIMKLLIFHNADVNKTFDRDDDDYGIGNGALGVTIGNKFKGSSSTCSNTEREIVRLEMVKILLEAGAKAPSNTLRSALKKQTPNVIQLLVESCDHVVHSKWIIENILRDAIYYLDNEFGTEIVRKIAQPEAIALCRTTHDISANLNRALNRAARTGNFELIQFFFTIGAKMTRQILSKSMCGGNIELVENLLERGADIHALVQHGRFGTITPLAQAIRSEDLQILDLLIGRGALSGVNERNRFFAALSAALAVKNRPMVCRLLDIGTDFDSRDLAELLIIVPEFREAAIVTLLIGEGVKFRNKNSKRARILMGQLERNSRSGEYDGNKNRQLLRSIFEGHTDIRHYSIGRMCSYMPSIILAAEQGNYDKARDLIDMGVDINEVYPTGYGSITYGDLGTKKNPKRWGCCESALTLSIRKGYSEITRLLLDSGADTNNLELKRRGGATALERAAKVESEIFEELLFKGADPNDASVLGLAVSQDMTLLDKLLEAYTREYPRGTKGPISLALAKAIYYHDELLIGKLLAVQVDVNELNTLDLVSRSQLIEATPLGIAIKEDRDVKLIEKLLNAGGDPESIVLVQPFGKKVVIKHSALLAAIYTRSLSIVQLLIQAGANVNRPATGGLRRTPLQVAAEIGDFEMVQYLLKEGAEVNAKAAKRGGATALQLAAIRGYMGIAEQLLNREADPNAAAAKIYGRTALEGAAEHGRIDMVRFLVDAGASIDQQQYERAGELAKRNGHMAVKRYLDDLYSQSLSHQSVVDALLGTWDA